MSAEQINELRRLLPECLLADRRRLVGRLQEAAAADPRRERQLSPHALEHMLRQARRSVAMRHRRAESIPPIQYPAELPITSRCADIISALRAHQVIVIAGETGSGKTTQIPKMCLEAGFGVDGRIGCTQPRRVAALSISRRIAAELNVSWGGLVGCKIRFADESSPETVIKMMTDGILLAEAQADPLLDEYEVLVIDEAHERSLNIDFLLGHFKSVLASRPELKLIITSATIDTEAFSAAFNHAPIIEVSGRLYPVEVRYAPHDLQAEESGELTYIDAAVQAVADVIDESNRGDILIFMPGERDIRETVDDLKGRHGGYAEIVPLYGRLTAPEQERVFAASARRKIIVATNIAETSLTIPGIRYVIDPGLARVSRYSPRTRTRRLPIEPISQSSANQRAGRSGRVADGICVRLYSQEEFDERPRFSQPEIQRANLAEVILRMKAFRLGEIESFPFINPPQPQAIKSGYQLLHELGALDAERQLTPLGRELARLPVDPSIGRMILQSLPGGAPSIAGPVQPRQISPLNVLPEVLVIAAGLSIQDPRERPIDRQTEADQAHRRFQDPRSDFLSLLNIWNAYHDQWDALKTQSQMRKFCHAHFLSYARMREWRDVHAQLSEAVAELAPADYRERAAAGQTAEIHYAAIHRSILSGLLGHIAQRTERNIYRAAGQREAALWPGSALFNRREQKTAPRGTPRSAEPSPAEGTHQPAWIVAGELVETSRLYARTVAAIQPEWIEEIASHLCQRTYTEPRWDRQAGRVLVRQRVSLFGLTVLENQIDYGRVDPAQATELFIRSALIEGDADSPHRFFEHNQRLCERIEVWRSRTRNHGLPDLEDAMLAFYTSKLENLSSIHDLNRIIRARSTAEPDFLCAREEDLTGGRPLGWDAEAFPAQVDLGGQPVAVTYAYAPGEEHDGVTLQVPAALAHNVTPGMLDWIIPGLREEQIANLIKELPKPLRVALMPTGPKTKELAGSLTAQDDLESLRRSIRQRYDVEIPSDLWRREQLSPHLRPRLAILGEGNKPVAAGRDLETLKRGLQHHETPAEQEAWETAARRWERYDLKEWSFGDLPEHIEVTVVAGTPWRGFPGLTADNAGVHLRLFRQREEAEAATREGWVRLAEWVLHRELGWLEKDLRALDKVAVLYSTLGSREELLLTAHANIRRHLLRPPEPILPLAQQRFDQVLARAKTELRTLVPGFVNVLTAILQLRQQALVQAKTYAGMRQDLDALLPARFVETIPYERLSHLPRYLKALLLRAERAALNPAKDKEKARLVQPYQDALSKLRGPGAAEFRWMLEEYKVSVFAQELGTAQPVSPKRLDAFLAENERR